MKRLLFFTLIIVFSSCTGESLESKNEENINYEMSFSVLNEDETGISFNNQIVESDSFNFFNYEYIYNGGGVAVGDINNDGLEDLYFSGNQVSDKLYINKGNLKFEDITDKAIGPLASEGWHTGVLMQDVNQDGWMDIYVSRSGPHNNSDIIANLLFINQGNETFKEEGEKYGVNINRPTTQSLFFDMDNDGDLDLYVMNHPYNTKNSGEPKKSVDEVNNMIAKGSPFSDVLLENREGKFFDITENANLNNHAFGLGIAASDVNNDGLTDLYISNDYMAPDYLYINNGDKTFSNKSNEQLQHMSNYSMGNEIADFNNDGLLDIMSVDMVSESHIRSKKNMGGMSTKRFWEVVSVGYHFQYMFNCLHLNNGNGTFSEIAQLSGVSKTDWSWAPIFADFNNDGNKDLFITNGYRRDTRDNDYVKRLKPAVKPIETFQDALDLIPEAKIENYMFLNNGDLTFSKVNNKWGTDQLVNSNGAVYSDLDNDGDLDLILNNMDETSFILRNNLIGNNYLDIELENSGAEGTTITVVQDTLTQFVEFRTVRGYQSSVSHVIHFGFKNNKRVDEIMVCWPNGKSQILNDIDLNQKLNLKMEDANIITKKVKAKKDVYFENTEVLEIVHQEKTVNDFEREVLLPNKMSQLGPFLSSGDVNGDGLEDFYFSGSRGYSGRLFVAKGKSFTEISGPWNQQSFREELGSVFFDADDDGDLDLYVTSGSNEFDYDSPKMEDQLYINEGGSKFVNKSDLLPKMQTSGQKVIAGDFDNDGDNDLFVAGRQTPGFYPFAPRSYLLENRDGKFADITENSIGLMGPGMITDAEFVDLDNDKDLDIVIVGEWMAPTFFRNDGGTFIDVTLQYGTQSLVGWWTSVTVADLNGDGKQDYVFGNIGMNNKFHPSNDHPLEIFTSDFDNNGTYDIVLGEYENGTCYPVRGKQCSSEQMPFVSQKFPTYSEFAVADLNKIYGEEKLKEALHFSANEFRSMLLLSNNNSFDKKYLNNYSQMGPLNAVIVKDFNDDGHADILACGNNFGAEVETVRYDGGRGVLLLGNGEGDFEFVSPVESGFFVNFDAKDMALVNELIVVTSNSNKVLFFKQIYP